LDLSLSVLLILAAVAILGVALLVVTGRLAAAQAGLAGRLSQMADSEAAAQARLSERLQAQERTLSRFLEDRLGDFSRRLGESLEKSATQTQTSMTDLKERLAVIDAAQKNITELSAQVVSLQDILANKQARGEFGEIQLRDLVSGVLPPSAYAFQVTLSNGKRADCVIRLPNPPGSIVIDSKFPLESYRALQKARDDSARKEAARSFGADIMTHVRDIAEKYIIPGETADSALMFLPSEAVYAELHANFAAIVEKAHRARVYTVSPTTLWATLNTVRAVLRDVRMREQAGVIQREVETMMSDVVRLDDRVGNLQRHFDLAVKDMSEIRTSADKVVKRGERIRDVELEEGEAEEAPPELPGSPPQLKVEQGGG
jgi:DNA recombination protein RmuC